MVPPSVRQVGRCRRGGLNCRPSGSPLARRLVTHAQAEETIFYPALLQRGDPDGLFTEETVDAIRDHNKIRDAIAEADRQQPGSPAWF